MKIAIDAMGGDFAPLEIVLGALEAVRETEHIDVVLVGDKTQIFKILEDNNETNNPRISVYHASQVSEWMSIRVKHCARRRMHLLWWLHL